MSVLGVVGINHQTASVDRRGHFAINSATGACFSMQALLLRQVVQEVLPLSTCNRTEFYYIADRPLHFNDFTECQDSDIKTYAYQSLEAVQHLMRVACGLESMIVGEGEILGQVKQAYHQASTDHTIGRLLDRLFQMSFAIAKQVRAQTHIGRHSVSLVQLASKLWQPIFSDIRQTTVLLVGAGKLAARIVQQLSSMGVVEIMIANRSEHKVLALAQQFAAHTKVSAITFSSLDRYLKEADIVISAAKTTKPLLTQTLLQGALNARRRQPILILDLGVPRTIEKSVGELEDIYLYDLDDLQAILEKHRSLRYTEALKAERLIIQAAQQFMRWLDAEESFKTVAIFRGQFDAIREALLADSLKRLQLGHDPEKILRRLAHDLTNQFLHKPTHRLRTAGLKGEHSLLQMIKELFELNHETLPSRLSDV